MPRGGGIGGCMDFRKFTYTSLEDLQNELKGLGLSLPLSENISVLKEPLQIGKKVMANRLAIQPMEGCDGTADGSPGPLTIRRYDRFSQSGAGLIWVEAVSIVPEGRANAYQLMLTEKNIGAFQKLVEDTKEKTYKTFGFEPILVMQATHSGRYSKPEGTAAPLIMDNNAHLEGDNKLPSSCIVSDEYLKKMEEKYAESAALAEKAGFDGVDVKACHRYLISESFSAYKREGAYGGSFENRIRFFKNALTAASGAVSSNVFITSRMNIYDGFPYPHGFGVSPDGGTEPELSEAIAIVKMLRDEFSVPVVDFTLGNPYFNPHVNRPFDQGPYELRESPLSGVARASACIEQVKKEVPGIFVISSALSYLRQYSGNLAAGQIETGVADIAGFGRQAFAYPSFVADLLQKGAMDAKKCCLSCSKCSQLMRASSTAGCVIRDEVYLSIYKKDVLENDKDIKNMVSNV